MVVGTMNAPPDVVRPHAPGAPVIKRLTSTSTLLVWRSK
jgi:hypothetical protein